VDPAAEAMTKNSSASEPAAVRWKRWLGYLFAVACLAWVFYDLHPRHLLAAIKIEHWIWLLPAVFFDVLTYLLQGIRWSLLLTPVGRVRPLRATQAIYAGLFTNEIMPLRLGELVRALLVSRWLDSGIAKVIPSLVVERFLDALWLAVGIGLAAILTPLPRDLLEAGDALGVIVFLLVALFLWIVLRKQKQLERGEKETTAQSKVLGFVSTALKSLAAGLRQIGISPNLYRAALLSAAMLVCQALAVWWMLLAYGLKLPMVAGAVVLLIVRLGTMIPNAPANVGSFQFFTVIALSLFGVEKTVAAGFSIVDFVVLTVPLWLLGLLALSKSGLTVASLRKEVASLRGKPAAQ
jgi:uncharacterized protein (TIRG00374 family)